MTLVITRGELNGFGTEAELAAAVTAFQAAIEAHKLTVGVPAPTAVPLVSVIVKQYGGDYSVEPEPDPPPPPGPPTRADIDVERERRIALPLAVTVPSGLTFTINMDPLAQRNIQGLASVGMYRNSVGSTDTTAFMDYDNTPRTLTPDDLVTMGLLVSQRISEIYGYNFALKAMDPIPADYTDDSYWA